MIQNSYKSDKGNLYIIPTPIGNLEDITFRSLKILKTVDAIFAEDTRVTKNLLNAYDFKNKIYVCHKFNEMKVSKSLIKLLADGKNLALVTDRGTPLISDPGSYVIKEVINNSFNVIALPGACAFIPAINMSNLSNERFLFYGFLNSKDSQAVKELEQLKSLTYTIIFYESPYRLIKTLENILKVLGNRSISISREITKLHEEVFRGTIEEAICYFKEPKGEFVIVVEGSQIIQNSYDESIQEILNLIKCGLQSKEAIKIIAKKNNLSKNLLYNMYEELKK